MRLKIIQTVIFFAVFAQAVAQLVRIEPVEIEKHNPKSIISNIYQDSRGFLWMGGFNTGLYRYDGYEFEYHSSDQHDPGSVSSNTISGISEDVDGNMLIGTPDGLNKLILDEGRFIKFRHNNDDQASISDNSITTLLKDSKSRIWVATAKGGLNLFNSETGTFERFMYEPGNKNSLASNHVTELVEAGEDTLWVGVYEGGINKFYIREKRFEKYFPTEWGHENYLHLNVNAIFKADSGHLWIGTRGHGLFHYNPRKQALENGFKGTDLFENPKYQNVTDVIFDHQDNNWAGTFRGSLICIKRNGEIKTYTPDLNRNKVSDWLVGGFYKDKEGTIIVGEWGPNLDKIYYTWPGFHHVLPFPEKFKAYDDFGNVVTAIFNDSDGDYWAGMQKSGVILYQNNHFDKFTLFDKKQIWCDYVTCFCETPGKIIWIGTIAGGLKRLQKNTGEIIHFNFKGEDRNSLSDDNVTCIRKENDSIIWIGTANGLNRLNIKREEFTRMFHDEGQNSLSDNYITALEFINGALYVGTKGGLNKKTGNKGFKRILHRPEQYNSLLDNYITCLAQGKNAEIWVGTNKGLTKYSEGPEAYEIFTKRQGLPDNTIQGILVDTAGNLWIGTGENLCRMDVSSGRIRAYGDDDNLLYGDIQRVAFAKNDTFYFGSNIGFYYFNPYDIKENSTPPTIRITGFNKIFKDKTGKEVIKKVNVFNQQKIRLKHDENEFEISFSAFVYKQTSKCFYKYKMLPLYNDWIAIGNNHKIRFKDLKPGRYRFQVMGTNNDQFMSEKPAELDIYLPAVLYKSTWFIAAMSILILFFLGYFFRTKISGLFNRKSSGKDVQYSTDLGLIHKTLEDKKLYLDSDLTLSDLANELDISSKDLSGFLNHRLKKNFADFINEYRVEEAKSRLLDAENKNIKIIYIAYDSGFNSKAAFYSVFKKHTGMTPTEFRKKNS